MYENMQVMKAEVVSWQKIKALQAEKTSCGEDHVTLQINGTNAAYEVKEVRYYIPRNMEEKFWKGSLRATIDGLPASVVWAEDQAFGDMEQAVREGHIFSCLVYNDTEYELVDVLFTGLPVMQIDGEMGAVGTRIRVFDPVKSVWSDYQTEDSNAYYNIRGNASRRFEKICYRLEFFSEDGSLGRDLSLLGMRSDNDWQLKAMYSDRSKLRDKLSIDLWNQIEVQTNTNADDGCHMEYLELIVNGEYRGLYGLVEPTDYKSLNLDKSRDYIYKVGADEWPNDQMFDQSEEEQSFICAGVCIRQSNKEYGPGIWEPFRTFWNYGYEMESEEDMEVLYTYIDRQNFINYNLYCNAIAGVDNRFKNIIYSTVMHSGGIYTIRRIPWDQNYSWGDDFETGEDKDEKNIRYNEALYEKWLNEEVFRNMQLYDPELEEDQRETWEYWRSSFLKEEYWKTHARGLMDYLVDSGAFSRDTKRWPDSGNVQGTEEIEAFIDARFVWMDGYLEHLEDQELPFL
ncbi:MAG: hypothetical protein HFI92_07630 [Lachnospiraceae bacterium]|nr:hypothetical protein [Lachnospiraceae bacterium]